ncbi:MAG: hypothetical protein MUO68_08375, partial [Desulfobacteraceae bacterium]|nr:hypothetical protein [Desulfobacteraceae bacterium]
KVASVFQMWLTEFFPPVSSFIWIFIQETDQNGKWKMKCNTICRTAPTGRAETACAGDDSGLLAELPGRVSKKFCDLSLELV